MTERLVMIIEDEPGLLLLYRKVLEKHGYEVLAATDGNQALRLLEEHTPQLIFLDVRLPVVDGLQVFKHIRSRERFNHTRVIINSSGSDYGRDLDRSHDQDEFLQKPIRAAQIAEIAARTMQR
ncbi:MAG: response regulator [Anaerolineae bacterium]|jgi:CheY-like chemotaxis protein|nr:response regulator [Anaerolineae bacterium]